MSVLYYVETYKGWRIHEGDGKVMAFKEGRYDLGPFDAVAEVIEAIDKMEAQA